MMLKIVQKPTFALLAALVMFSCSDDDDAKPIRTAIDYTLLDAKVPYSEQFKDEAGTTTVDLTEGNNRFKMFQALNYYSTSNVAANTAIDAAQLKKLFSNTANPFVDISTSSISVTGATLNASGLQLRNITASSKATTEAEAVRAKLEVDFDDIAEASLSISQTAEKGVAGKISNYLVDARGIEIAQVIQKSLIGAMQLDYIGNVLLDEGLEANNSTLVSGKAYTQREHNWDEAYGFLTLNAVYLYDTATEVASTDGARATIEFGIGSYIWEYNKANYALFFPAFVKGRAAIVNNDQEELETQATFIRTQMERTIANAAIGYLEKWKAGNSTEASRVHAIGEGIGFIYSLRFASIHGADAAWSDGIIEGLIGSTDGYWDLDAIKINTAVDAIKLKFEM
jgi:hypothetical protein